MSSLPSHWIDFNLEATHDEHQLYTFDNDFFMKRLEEHGIPLTQKALNECKCMFLLALFSAYPQARVEMNHSTIIVTPKGESFRKEAIKVLVDDIEMIKNALTKLT